MHRRTNRKNPLHDTSDIIDSVMCTYNSMYGDVKKDVLTTVLPNVLNFDIDNVQKYNQDSSKNLTLFENGTNIETNKGKDNKSVAKQAPIGTKSNEKYGVKTLVNIKSKMVYPFDKTIEQPLSKETVPATVPVSNDIKEKDSLAEYSKNIINDLDEYIIKESLTLKETFIKPETVIKSEKKVDPINNATSTTLVDAQYVPMVENFSDLENRMGKSTQVKKIDNKIDNKIDENIVNIEIKEETITNMETGTKQTTSSPTNEDLVESRSSAVEQVVSESIEKHNSEEKVETKLDEKVDIKWPELTIENIITTFKVVGDLREGYKLKIENDRFLTIDASYIPSITRWRSDQGREKIINFIGHLLKETKRTINKLVKDIRDNIDVDANISVVEKMISRMSIFLHTYDVMKITYKGDAGAYARLGAIRDEFYDFRGNLFRDILISKK